MENGEKIEKFVHLNPRISSIELNLPEKYKKYGENLQKEIKDRFSFNMMDSDFEERVERFVREYIADREENNQE